MDGALVQDDGIDWIVEELDRCWEVTQDQDKASKIEKALFETQRDVKMETTFMSSVARRKLNVQQLESALGTPLPAVIKVYATLRDAKLAESSYDKVVMWTTSCLHWCGWIAVRCDLEQVDKAARPYRHISLTWKWMHRQSFQVPRFGHNQVWTDHTGTRFSTHCKRRSISARTERRRSHAMERSPFRAASTLPTMVRRQLKRMRYRRYYCRLDQLSDILGTGLSERISMLRRSPEVSSAPDEVRVAEIRDRA